MNKGKRKLSMFAVIMIVMAAFIVLTYGLLTTDAFIDVGEINEMAGNDTTRFDKSRVISESAGYIEGLFASTYNDETDTGENSLITGDGDSADGSGVWTGETVDTTGTDTSSLPSPGTGSGGNVVGTVCMSIPLYSDSTQQGGTFVDARSAYATKGLSNYNNWACWEHNVGGSAWKENGNISKIQGRCIDANGNLSDPNGRVLIAVGPAVMNPGRDSMSSATATEMRYGTMLDVVLSRDGVYYYIKAVVADCKAHTYPSGIIQTGYKVSGGRVGYVAPGADDITWTECVYDMTKAQAYKANGVVEFCAIKGDTTKGSENYELVGFIVY